jgi:hypothetical protein
MILDSIISALSRKTPHKHTSFETRARLLPRIKTLPDAQSIPILRPKANANEDEEACGAFCGRLTRARSLKSSGKEVQERFEAVKNLRTKSAATSLLKGTILSGLYDFPPKTIYYLT